MNFRSFIAVEMPAEVHRAITQSINPLQKALPKPIVRWVEPENIHLTLKFLGDVSPENLEGMADALKAELAAHESFSITVGGLGAFPSSNRPRIIWIGLQFPPSLSELQRSVDNVATRMGFAPEERPFSPHLTIGRVGQGITQTGLAEIKMALEATAIGNLGTIHVGAVHIFKSDLKSTGPIYTRLYSLPMK